MAELNPEALEAAAQTVRTASPAGAAEFAEMIVSAYLDALTDQPPELERLKIKNVREASQEFWEFNPDAEDPVYKPMELVVDGWQSVLPGDELVPLSALPLQGEKE